MRRQYLIFIVVRGENMNLLSSFSDFYNGLSSDGLFFFWIIVFLFCFLVFLAVVLFIKNRKLSKLLDEENTTLDDEKIIVKKEVSFDDRNDIKIEKEEILEKEEEILEIKEEVKESVLEPVVEVKKEVVKESKIEKKEETGPYKKNVLREMNARRQTSPISISKNDVIYNTNNDLNDNYEIDEVYLREDSVSPLEMMEDSYEVNDNMRFASEIVERMEEEIKPSNIELTDYEKKQEEEAIISYDELLKVKDRIYNITEDEETDEFIDQLKSFRLDL